MKDSAPTILFNPFTGQPRDQRDIGSDPHGMLLIAPGQTELRAATDGEKITGSKSVFLTVASGANVVGLHDLEQYRMQMAGISTAALGYWKEGQAIHPDYDTTALRDVAKLYARFNVVHKALTALVADLEMRANWKHGDDKGVIDCGNGVYVDAKLALDPTVNVDS